MDTRKPPLAVKRRWKYEPPEKPFTETKTPRYNPPRSSNERSTSESGRAGAVRQQDGRRVGRGGRESSRLPRGGLIEIRFETGDISKGEGRKGVVSFDSSRIGVTGSYILYVNCKRINSKRGRKYARVWYLAGVQHAVADTESG